MMRCLWPCIKIEQVEITVLYSKNLLLDLLEICCLLKSDILSLCSCFHRAHGFLTWLVQDVYIYIERERDWTDRMLCFQTMSKENDESLKVGST